MTTKYFPTKGEAIAALDEVLIKQSHAVMTPVIINREGDGYFVLFYDKFSEAKGTLQEDGTIESDEP